MFDFFDYYYGIAVMMVFSFIGSKSGNKKNTTKRREKNVDKKNARTLPCEKGTDRPFKKGIWLLY